MNTNTIEFWIPILNITVISFCLVIIIYLGIHYLRYQKKNFHKRNDLEGKHNMDNEILIQIIKQETEAAFNNILAALKKEHKKLQKTIMIGDLRNTGLDDVWNNEMVQITKEKKRSIEIEKMKTPNKEVLEMIRQGKDIKQISNKMQISLEEIDLILELENTSK